ncbi:hypothetical protein HAHI6034_11730 [Hathewaya histolytica]|uniref:Uncharacterized protein n=1 Tax=Hathewaya histolytica TaxID=1498 RepID=A0A4U9RBN3_HATHI|nr:Uncharacterised protein [Hathewaya histolytica]
MSFIMCLVVILFLIWLISLKFAERIGNLTIKYIIKPIKNILKGDK